MHTAFWGLFAGLTVAYLCRGLGAIDSEETRKRQAEVRAWLDSVDSPSENGKKWRAWMKILVPVWFFFAIGRKACRSSVAAQLLRHPSSVAGRGG